VVGGGAVAAVGGYFLLRKKDDKKAPASTTTPTPSPSPTPSPTITTAGGIDYSKSPANLCYRMTMLGNDTCTLIATRYLPIENSAAVAPKFVCAANNSCTPIDTTKQTVVQTGQRLCGTTQTNCGPVLP
jgi:hypothetical protein